SDKDQPGFFSEAIDSALYYGVQSPINGLFQIPNHYSRKDILPSVHLVDAPKENSSWSGWLGQQIGGAVGVAFDFWLLGKTGSAINSKLGGAAAETAKSISVSENILGAAKTGFAYDAIFKPVQDNENFELARFRNGTIGGLTFGTVTGATI